MVVEGVVVVTVVVVVVVLAGVVVEVVVVSFLSMIIKDPPINTGIENRRLDHILPGHTPERRRVQAKSKGQ